MSTKHNFRKRWIKIQEDAERLGLDVIFAVLPKAQADDMGFTSNNDEGAVPLEDDLRDMETLLSDNEHYGSLPDLFAERSSIERVVEEHKTIAGRWIRKLNELDEKIVETQAAGYDENLTKLRVSHPTEKSDLEKFLEGLGGIVGQTASVEVPAQEAEAERETSQA